MDTSARKAVSFSAVESALGIDDTSAAQRLLAEIEQRAGHTRVTVASTFAKLQHLALADATHAILLDDRILGGLSLAASLQPFERLFPVILLAPLERQTEAAEWVARGEIEFVAREGEYFGLAASLLERRLRSAESRKAVHAPISISWPSDIGEVIRHEINNPLTGILGNAELVLSHRENLSTVEAQRLETVVGLAVRLRETVRRLSDSIETQHRSVAV